MQVATKVLFTAFVSILSEKGLALRPFNRQDPVVLKNPITLTGRLPMTLFSRNSNHRSWNFAVIHPRPTFLPTDEGVQSRESVLVRCSRKWTRQTAAWLTLGLLFVWCLGCGGDTNGPTPDPQSGLTTVRLQLNWVPEAEHGGFYAAQVHGYFREEGLEVEIVPGGVQAPVLQQVVMERVQFGVSNADWIVLGRNDGAKVQALMAPIQDSPRCILVRPEVQAQDFSDLKNLTLAASPNNPFLAVMQKKLPLEKVQLVPYQSMQAFLSNERFAQQGYSFSEPFLAQQQGVEPTVLMVSQLGFNPYTSCLVASEKMIESNPQLVRKFVRASVRGWETYMKNPEETNQEIARLNPDQDTESLSFAWQNLRELCGWDSDSQTFSPAMGHMSAERFEQLGRVLQGVDFLKKDVDPSVYQEAFDASFLIKSP